MTLPPAFSASDSVTTEPASSSRNTGHAMIRTAILLFALFAGSGLCQRIAVGVKLGARLSDDIEGHATSESKRYAFGPAI